MPVVAAIGAIATATTSVVGAVQSADAAGEAQKQMAGQQQKEQQQIDQANQQQDEQKRQAQLVKDRNAQEQKQNDLLFNTGGAGSNVYTSPLGLGGTGTGLKTKLGI